ncbi:MAG TPA: TonB family protein [Gemmatimonadaceae bacterium]|jgi:protein TonB
MSINLIESERSSQRSLGGTFVSIALHASLITVAVYATANAGVIDVKVPIDTVTVFYPPQPEESPHTPHTPAHPDHSPTPALPREPVPRAPIDIPDKLPPIDSSIGRIPAESLFTSGALGAEKRGAGSLTGSDSGEPMRASEVDKPVAAREGNPVPKYPSLLESSRVEGSVLVQFVIDTLGSVEMQSIKVLASSNELFVQSLLTALPKWRFYPAEAGGRKVKQIVQLPLKFVAPRR